jgi:hypothetical protein
MILPFLLAACGASPARKTPPSSSARQTPDSTGAPSSEHTSAANTLTVSGHSAKYTGPITSAFRSAKPDITIAPVSGAAAGADWQQAFRACFAVGKPGCVATGSAVIALGTVDGPSGYPSPSGNLFDHSAAFVITWDAGPCTTTTAPRCRVVDIVPTDTYAVTYAFEIAATTQPPVGAG